MEIWTCIHKINQDLDLPCVENLTVNSVEEIDTVKYEVLNRQFGLENELLCQQ